MIWIFIEIVFSLKFRLLEAGAWQVKASWLVLLPVILKEVTVLTKNLAFKPSSFGKIELQTNVKSYELDQGLYY